MRKQDKGESNMGTDRMFQDAAEGKAGMPLITMVTILMVPFQYSKEEAITLHLTESRYA